MHTVKTSMELEKLGNLADHISGMGNHTAHRSDFNALADRVRLSADNLRKLHNDWLEGEPTTIDAPYVEVIARATHDDVTREDRDIFAVPTADNSDIEYYFKHLDCVTHEVQVLIADPANATPHSCLLKIDHGGYVKPFTEEKDFAVKLFDCLRDGDSIEKTMDTVPAEWNKRDDL